MNRLGDRSLAELMGVHPHMIVVVTTALIIVGDEYDLDFTVVDGIRTLAEQKDYVRRKVSWTLNSKHIKQRSTGYGHAVDLYPLVYGKIKPNDIEALKKIGRSMKKAASHHDIPTVWGALKKHGGDWSRRNDMYHFELDDGYY